VVEEVERLEDEPDALVAQPRQRLVVQLLGRLAVDDHLALVGPVEAADDVEQRRLARARLADHRDQFAGGDVEGDATQHLLARLAGAVRFLHAGEVDDRLAVTHGGSL
jgi:hypothetical protein